MTRSQRMLSPTPATGRRIDAAHQRVMLRNPWFGRLSARLRDEILGRCTMRQVASGSLVYATGAAPNGLFCVLGGEVRLEHHASSGKYAFYHSLPPGEFFGLLSELDGSPRFSNARASADSRVAVLPHADVQDLYRHDEEARDAFVGFLCQNLHETLQMLVEVHSAPPRAQIAQVLVSIFSHEAAPDGSQPRLTQEALALMAGVSRQTTNKVLREFREQGWVATTYGRVAPLDLDALGELSRQGQSLR